MERQHLLIVFRAVCTRRYTLCCSVSKLILCVQQENFIRTSTPNAHASPRSSKYPKIGILVLSYVYDWCLDTRTSTPNAHASQVILNTWHGHSCSPRMRSIQLWTELVISSYFNELTSQVSLASDGQSLP